MNIMTIMKKTSIKWLILIMLIIFITGLVIFLNYQNSHKVKFLNYPANYSLCNNNLLDLNIYCNTKKLSFFDVENISKAMIIDEDKNCYHVNIEKIVCENKVSIEDKDYYLCTLQINIPIQSEMVLQIPSSKLKLVNKRSEEIVFDIGNISILNSDFLTIVDMKKIVGTTKMCNNYFTLDKIQIELYNSQNYDVILKNIELVSNVVKTEVNEQKILTKKGLELEIPLIYLEETFIDSVGLLLTLEYQGTIYQQLINPYVLFKTTSKHTQPVVQTYEIY